VPFLKDDIVSLKVGTLARIAVEILFVVLASTGLRQAQPDNCSSIDKTIKRLQRIAGLASNKKSAKLL